jgi:hypothetical protein
VEATTLSCLGPRASCLPGWRALQRTISRPGEMVQCDLWEPRDPVRHGQTRRGWVATAELWWSLIVAGALIFSELH